MVDTLHHEPAADCQAQMRARGMDFTFEEERGVFICTLRCAIDLCAEKLAVSGWYDVAVFDTPEVSQEEEEYHPLSITPAPPLIRLPSDCPQGVQAEVRAAFAAFWADKAACLNHIRQAVELLLTRIRVPRFRMVNTHGVTRRRRRTLHDRIEWLRATRPTCNSLCDQLRAVKHLGNVGSHPGIKVADGDVFDGFDILERILVERYENTGSELAQMVREINRREGPRRADGE
jgi:hypothetical protein